MSDDKQKSEGDGLYQSKRHKCANGMIDGERQELLNNDFTRVPNIIFQMQKVLKNGSVYACFQFIWCKTGGWDRNEDTIAYSQFANDKRYGTGLSLKTIRRSVEKLADLGVITMSPGFNNMHEFSLNISRIKELVGEQGWSNRPLLENESMVNLSQSMVNLSKGVVNLSSEHGQSDHHIRTTTQELLHKNTNNSDEVENGKPKKVDVLTEQALSLVDYWNNNHGKNKSADVKPSVWLDKVKARLKKFSSDEIKLAMLSVIQSSWHQKNGQVLIKNAISSDQRCDEAISRYHQSNPISYQGNNNANNQTANSQHQQFDTSTTAGYAAKLDADAERYYAEQSAIAQQAADGSFEGTF